MKMIEKLARECVEKRRQEIYDEECQPTDEKWFIPVYEAGFRKAREMCQEHANWVGGQEIKESRDGSIPLQIAMAFAFAGEQEME